MKKLLSLLTILALAVPTFADFDGLPENVRANLGAIQKYPKSSCILLWCSENYTLNSDGSQVYEWHSFRYIPDEAARDEWGDPHIAFLDGKQKLEILAAQTYTQDGRQINSTPENAFNPIVPESGFDLAPDYADVRQMVVTMLGLENGCISELYYRLTTFSPVLPWMEGHVYFREEWPVISRELTVSIPASVHLNYKAEHGVSEASQSGTTYSWKVNDQPDFLREDLSGHQILLPNVIFSTAPSWEEVHNLLYSRIRSKIQDTLAIPESLTAELRNTYGEVNRLEAIKTWVRERFNLLKLNLGEFDWSLRPAARILESGYGNEMELAILAATLANQTVTKCNANPFFYFEPAVPSVQDAAGWLVWLEFGDNAFFESDPLKPREDFTRRDRSGYYLMFGKPVRRLLPWKDLYKASGPSRFNLTMVLEDLDKDTLRGHGRFEGRVGFAPYEIVGEKGADAYLKSLVQIKDWNLDKTQVEHLDDSKVTIDFEFTVPSGIERIDDRCLLPTKLVDFIDFVKGAPMELTSREFPQEIPIAGDMTVRLEALIPSGWDAESRPGGGDFQWGESSANVTSSSQLTYTEGEPREILDRRVVIERSLHLQGEWLAPDHWKSFREWLLYAGPQASPPIVFKTTDKK